MTRTFLGWNSENIIKTFAYWKTDRDCCNVWRYLFRSLFLFQIREKIFIIRLYWVKLYFRKNIRRFIFNFSSSNCCNKEACENIYIFFLLSSFMKLCLKMYIVDNFRPSRAAAFEIQKYSLSSLPKKKPMRHENSTHIWRDSTFITNILKAKSLSKLKTDF